MKSKIRIDASALAKSSCMLRTKRIIFEGLRENKVYNDTAYGTAFHAFQKAMFKTNGDFGESAMSAKKEFIYTDIRKKHLDEHHLLKTCLDFWEQFDGANKFEVAVLDGQPMVELQFEIPFYSDEQYDVVLTGTIDCFGKIPNGVYAIRDYKTHSLWSMSKKGSSFIETEIKTYLSGFQLAVQLRFYAFCLKYLAKQNPGSELANICSKPIGMFIDAIFLSSTTDTQFRRSDIWIMKESEYDEMYVMLHKFIKDFIYSINMRIEYRDGIIHGSCYEGKFSCQYLNLCQNHTSPAIVNLIKQKDYTTVEYNPLKFSEAANYICDKK